MTGEDGGAARGSVPSFRTPERAVAALAHAVRYGRWLDRPVGSIPVFGDVRPDQARALVQGWRAADPRDRSLTDAELLELLGCYGIGHYSARGRRQPVAAVVAAERTVALGVKFSLIKRCGIGTTRSGCGCRCPIPRRFCSRHPRRRQASVRSMQAMGSADRGTVSTVLGVTADQSFGALVSFGIGGVATELLDDLAFQAVPLTDADAADLLDGPAGRAAAHRLPRGRGSGSDRVAGPGAAPVRARRRPA